MKKGMDLPLSLPALWDLLTCRTQVLLVAFDSAVSLVTKALPWPGEACGFPQLSVTWEEISFIPGSGIRKPMVCTPKLCSPKALSEDFPGDPVIKALHIQYKGRGFNPWLGSHDPTCCVVSGQGTNK